MDISETVQKVLQEVVVPDLGKIKAQIVPLPIASMNFMGEKNGRLTKTDHL